MDMVAKNFENFGIRLAEAKMVTMTWNMPMETMTKKLPLTRPGTRQPWRTKKTPQFLTYQVGSAYRAGKRMKMVLTDFRITLKNRVIIRQSMVRSRLTYASGPGECGWKKRTWIQYGGECAGNWSEVDFVAMAVRVKKKRYKLNTAITISSRSIRPNQPQHFVKPNTSNASVVY